MGKNDEKPETQPSSPPTRPPKPPVVTAGIGDSGEKRPLKADFGCHVALWVLAKRYHESDIHGAYSVLVEQEQLLRDHIGFPGYKAELGFTMAKRSDIALHLGDAQAAAVIMEEAISFLTGAVFPGKPSAARPGVLTSEFMLKLVRELEADANIKWRQNHHTA